MRFSNLTEYNRQATANNFGDKLVTAASTDTTIGEVNTIDDILSKLEEADPTKNKKYTQWIAKVYAQGGYKYEDVSSVVADGLAKFDKLKNQKIVVGTDADIGRYPDFDKFLDFINQHDEPVEKQKQDRGDYLMIHDGPTARIIWPKDEAAAKFWGQSTKWCTAADKNNFFNQYNDDSLSKRGLRILIPKEPSYPGEKYQFYISLSENERHEDYDVVTTLSIQVLAASDKEQQETTETSDFLRRRFGRLYEHTIKSMFPKKIDLEDFENQNITFYSFLNSNFDLTIGLLGKPDSSDSIGHEKWNYLKNLTEDEQIIDEALAQQIQLEVRVSNESKREINDRLNELESRNHDEIKRIIEYYDNSIDTQYQFNYSENSRNEAKKFVKSQLDELYSDFGFKHPSTYHVTISQNQDRTDIGAYDNSEKNQDLINMLQSKFQAKPMIDPRTGKLAKPAGKSLYSIAPFKIKNLRLQVVQRRNVTFLWLVFNDNTIKQMKSDVQKTIGSKEFSFGYQAHIHLMTVYHGQNSGRKNYNFPRVNEPDDRDEIISPAKPDDFKSSFGGADINKGFAPASLDEINLSGLKKKLIERLMSIFIKDSHKLFDNFSVTFDSIGTQIAHTDTDITTPSDLFRISSKNTPEQTPNVVARYVVVPKNEQGPRDEIMAFGDLHAKNQYIKKHNFTGGPDQLKVLAQRTTPDEKRQYYSGLYLNDRINVGYGTQARNKKVKTNINNIPTTFVNRGIISPTNRIATSSGIRTGVPYWEPVYVDISTDEGVKSVQVQKVAKATIFRFTYTIPGYIWDFKTGWIPTHQWDASTQELPGPKNFKQWSQSNQSKINESIIGKKHIYVDMDGVVADFHTDFQKFGGDIKELAASDPITIFKLYRNLRPLADGVKLVKYLQDNNIQFTFLSAPLRKRTKTDSSGSEASKLAKVEWLKQHFPGMENNVEFTSEKSKFAGDGNILIDDREVFLGPWKEAGGEGILYKNYSGAVSELEKLLSTDRSKFNESSKYLGPTTKVRINKKGIQVPLNKKGFGV